MESTGLAQLTDSYVAPNTTFPVEPLYAPAVNAITIRPVIDAQVPERVEPRPEPMGLLDNFGMAGVANKSGKSESPLIKKLFGLGGEERYQLWPEKVVRDALGAAGEVAASDPTANLGLRREDFTDIPPPSMPTGDSTWLGKALGVAPVAAQPNDYMIDAAQSMAALAGSGGLAGTTDATLGAGPFLRPALKYDNKIYKAPLNGQHLDALPQHLQETFHKQAMSGEDISHFNFGFMNHKGQFLSREAALDYAIKEGLVDPHAGQYGALTSTLLADSSKPGTAIEAMAKTNKPAFYSALEHNVNQITQSKMTGDQWLGTLANKPGVKPEELQWTGVKDFLKERGSQPVSKTELQEHLATNKVELKEVEKRGSGSDPDNFDSPRYASYQLPGASNYREKLLTLPQKGFSGDAAAYAETLHSKYGTDNFNDLQSKWSAEEAKTYNGITNTYKSAHWDEPNILAHVRMNDRFTPVEYTAEEKAAVAARQAGQAKIDAIRQEQGAVGKQIRDTAKPLDLARILGIVADLKAGKISNPEAMKLFEASPEHPELKPLQDKLQELRAKEDALAKTLPKQPEQKHLKSLHMEEIQSDWHQQGRDKGYNNIDAIKQLEKKTTVENAPLAVKSGLRQSGFDLDKIKNEDIYVYGNSGYSLKEPATNETMRDWVTDGVPDAPFKKSWHELALKRMIREAAEISHKSEIANWENLVHTSTDDLAHKLVKNGMLKEICE